MTGVIGFFNSAEAWGGGEKWHYEVSRYLHENGIDVVVFAHRKSVLLEKLKKTNVPHIGISLSNMSILNPYAYAKVYQLLRKFNVASIIINLSRDLKIAGKAAKMAGVKRIIYRRGSAIPIENSLLNRYYFKDILTDVLANSEATKRTVLQNNPFLFPKEKITVIYNGINVDQLPKTSVEENGFRLLTLGRLEYQKNHEFLIRLAAELKQRHLNFQMIIGGEGRLRGALEKLSNELGVQDVVRFAGFIETPLEFINTADIFLLPSYWEGFGYVLAEASLCQKPIIAFNLSSNPELVIEGETGFLVPENDIDQFADRVMELYQDKEKRTAFGKNGFHHIVQNFDEQKQLRKLQDYLVNE
ncbi:glycosyltransferase [Robiginitalea aurantiaca]|uniref:Glycosyltransferase n=1 Tax=Robiginitalea aurantiaca TaxID=3056915 RepID=A0ABT7WI54_9FLAO|nr:glycosyltransferase [Robiginitalea aurantiaca]MDM9632613.1 glycosyltransferase [Robiginitalea aurantiaca]